VLEKNIEKIGYAMHTILKNIFLKCIYAYLILCLGYLNFKHIIIHIFMTDFNIIYLGVWVQQ